MLTQAANALPSKWGWERFVVIPAKPQENEIALWQPDHNRALASLGMNLLDLRQHS